MKLTKTLLLSAVCAAVCLPALRAAEINTLTPEEKAAGWSLVFDGKTFNGLRGYKMKGLPEAGWVIKDGLLGTVAKVKGKELVTEKVYHDFELSWEWNISKAGNNGIKYFVTEDPKKAPGHEYQMIDDLENPDGKKAGPLHMTASFYDVLPAAPGTTGKAPGEWNSSRISVKGNHVEHWLNGKLVLTYELGSPEVMAGVAKSKFKKFPNFGNKEDGHIMLTYHNDECWYRNIKIREL